MSFAQNHSHMTQQLADEQKRQDAALQRKTIVGDEDGHWLSHQIEALQQTDEPICSEAPRRYRFLSDDEEVVLHDLQSGAAIEMPAGSVVRRLEGDGFRTWVFRVDNGCSGDEQEFFDLAYRKIASGAHMLYLRQHDRGRVSSSQ